MAPGFVVDEPTSVVPTTSEKHGKHRVGIGIPWGSCVMTPVYTKGVVTSYAIDCRVTSHLGHCQKTRSFKASGGVQITRRELKAWILYGLTTVSKDEHAKFFQRIAAAGRSGHLPEESELDEFAFDDWSEVQAAPPVLPPLPASAKRAKAAASSSTSGDSSSDSSSSSSSSDVSDCSS